MAARVSAGLLLYRRTGDGIEVLLAHMGGPFWERRERAWTIPKGEPEPDEDDLLAVAVREFTEELGVAPPPPTSPDLPLGSVRQSGGKVVHAWAREGSVDETSVRSNTVEVEWPPRSGRTLTVPEVDRAAWFTPGDARLAVVAAQAELVERLAQALG